MEAGLQLHKVKEVAEFLRCSEAVVRRLVKDGHLPHITVGKSVRIRGDDLMRFCDRNDKKV